jgi:hypothetical protein
MGRFGFSTLSAPDRDRWLPTRGHTAPRQRLRLLERHMFEALLGNQAGNHVRSVSEAGG